MRNNKARKSTQLFQVFLQQLCSTKTSYEYHEKLSHTLLITAILRIRCSDETPGWATPKSATSSDLWNWEPSQSPITEGSFGLYTGCQRQGFGSRVDCRGRVGPCGKMSGAASTRHCWPQLTPQDIAEPISQEHSAYIKSYLRKSKNAGHAEKWGKNVRN